MLSYNWFYFVLALIATIIPFLWVRKKDTITKLYFFSIAAFVFIYSGVGCGWEGCPTNYIIAYIVYMFFFGITCYFTQRHQLKQSSNRLHFDSQVFCEFIDRYGKWIIIIYIFLLLSGLFLAGKISNLIHPPTLNLYEAVEYEEIGFHGSALEMLVYYVRGLLFPFYLLVLYKYRNSLIIFSLLILFPLYVQYATNGYIARSGVLPFVLMIFLVAYIQNPQYRKTMVVSAALGLPSLLIFLAWFTFARIGASFDLSGSDAISLLFYEETHYPLLFTTKSLWNINFDLASDYINWLVTMPLPGFLKDSTNDYFFNAIFTEIVLGTSRSQAGFSVALPGLVGESIFLFGGYLFFIHAIICGLIYGISYRWLRTKYEIIIVLYLCMFSGSVLARAGTVSTYPFFFKGLLLYFILFFIMKSSYKKRRHF